MQRARRRGTHGDNAGQRDHPPPNPPGGTPSRLAAKRDRKPLHAKDVDCAEISLSRLLATHCSEWAEFLAGRTRYLPLSSCIDSKLKHTYVIVACRPDTSHDETSGPPSS
ncbi:hypothetical protein BD310DRAFT_930346 [Dichomitus squalens]|uniref:Uncharacterized protein n=1 Tax=Dichomitus squalens TaxID=114155 RepID=A0A4Q9PRM7_9APHY|nr:hypothetical protein BD310DRAFT_930346 [Dichomitus squalens]